MNNFKLTEREGKVALWCWIPSGWKNIWDITRQECTPNVLAAVRNAVSVGERRYEERLRDAMKDGTAGISHNDTWSKE